MEAMIINLTQHPATPEQVEAGVFEPADKSAVQRVLTFDTLPTVAEIVKRAETLAQIADQSGASIAMIGGAPYLMSALEKTLTEYGIMPLYSFSVRQSVEKVQDGTVVKTNVFRHAGWIEAV